MSGDERPNESQQAEKRVWETTDMSLAAWMRAQGKRLIKISRNEERRKEFRFVFEDKDPNTPCDGLALDFLNSDAHAFDTALRALKKMCFGPGGVRNAISTRS